MKALRAVAVLGCTACVALLGPVLPGRAGAAPLPVKPALGGPLAPLDPGAVELVPQADGTFSSSYTTDIGTGALPPLPQPGLDPIGGRIQTFAGGSADGGAPTASTLFQPYHVAVAPDGSLVVADTYNNRVRRVAGGVVSTVAGTGDAGFAGDGGLASGASLNFPTMVAVGPGGVVYVADTWNDRVRRVDPLTGLISTVAGVGPNEGTSTFCGQGDGGPATAAALFAPTGLAVLPDGDLLVADMRCHTLRRLDVQTGVLSTVAGRGEAFSTFDGDGAPATGHALPAPIGVATWGGNALVADSSRRIRYVNLSVSAVTLFPGSASPLVVAPGEIRTIAGTGELPGPADPPGQPSRSAGIATPRAISVAADGGVLFSEDAYLGTSDADTRNTMRVRRIDPATGIISTLAGNRTVGVGTDGVPATTTPLAYPSAAVADAAGNVLVADRGNNRLRRVTTATGLVDTAAGKLFGDGLPAVRAQLSHPFGVTSNYHGVYVMDTANRRLRRIDPDGTITTVLGGGPPCVMQGAATTRCNDGPTGDGGPGTTARLTNKTWAIAASPDGLIAVIDDNRIRLLNDTDTDQLLRSGVTLPAHAVTTIAGGGATPVPWLGSVGATTASLSQPRGIAFHGDDLLVTEMSTGADRVDRLDLIEMWNGEIRVFAGSPYATAQAGASTWVDGHVVNARFFQPYGVTVADTGDIYVADAGNNRVRQITPELQVTTVAGNGALGFAGDGGPATAAVLAEPSDVDVAPDGSLLIVDAANLRVRRVAPDGIIRTLVGSGESLVNRTCTSARPCAHYGGDGGPALTAQLNVPTSVTLLSTSVLVVADRDNNRLRAVPLALPGFPPPGCLTASRVAAASCHTLALRPDGTVWAWGNNGYGELGNGTTTPSPTPVQVSGLSGVVAVAGGFAHSLALRGDGTVWSWGGNNAGQIGDGTQEDRFAPVQVTGLTGVTAIAAGLFHSLALKSDGTVWSWGLNEHGELGDSFPKGFVRTTPDKVRSFTGGTAVAAGAYTSFAIGSNGTVWGWGSNEWGELGDGTTHSRWQPAQVSGLANVVGVSTTNAHVLATRADGTVWAWGYNGDGELGDGSTVDARAPVQVSGLTGVVAAAAGDYHSLAVRADGTVWAWGDNWAGQLGDGTTTTRWSPVAVAAVDGVAQVSGGSGHSVVLRADGTVWAWGYNWAGQLGDGTNVNRGTRVPVGACS